MGGMGKEWPGLAWRQQGSSFSEEKEAKRLCLPAAPRPTDRSFLVLFPEKNS
jgi:hypothetical protein